MESQIADLQKQLIQLKQTIILHDACWANNIPKDQCAPQQDGSLKAPAQSPSPAIKPSDGKDKTPLNPR